MASAPPSGASLRTARRTASPCRMASAPPSGAKTPGGAPGHGRCRMASAPPIGASLRTTRRIVSPCRMASAPPSGARRQRRCRSMVRAEWRQRRPLAPASGRPAGSRVRANGVSAAKWRQPPDDPPDRESVPNGVSAAKWRQNPSGPSIPATVRGHGAAQDAERPHGVRAFARLASPTPNGAESTARRARSGPTKSVGSRGRPARPSSAGRPAPDGPAGPVKADPALAAGAAPRDLFGPAVPPVATPPIGALRRRPASLLSS